MKSRLSLAVGARRAWRLGFVLLLALLLGAAPLEAREYEAEQQRIEQFFPGAKVSAAEG